MRKGSCVTQVGTGGRKVGKVRSCMKTKYGTLCTVRWGRGYGFTSLDVPKRELRACSRRRRK